MNIQTLLSIVGIIGGAIGGIIFSMPAVTKKYLESMSFPFLNRLANHFIKVTSSNDPRKIELICQYLNQGLQLKIYDFEKYKNGNGVPLLVWSLQQLNKESQNKLIQNLREDRKEMIRQLKILKKLIWLLRDVYLDFIFYLIRLDKLEKRFKYLTERNLRIVGIGFIFVCAIFQIVAYIL